MIAEPQGQGPLLSEVEGDPLEAAPGGPVPMEPQPQPEALAPDPASAAIDMILGMPGPDAVRRVYQLAVSAAKAKTRLDAAKDRMDARAYHTAISQTPEVAYLDVLLQSRRELDYLAQERRRLNLEATKARKSNRPASIYELHSAATTMAMEQVAGGVLLFLALPTLPSPTSTT